MRTITIQLSLLLVTASLGALVGCSSEPQLRLERLELVPEEEDTIEFALGDYDIPIPESGVVSDSSRPPRNYLQLEFSLYAEIVPGDEAHLADVFVRHEGVVRDRVIHIFRNASYEDLEEPNLLTLKLRLLDAIEPVLGLNVIRHMIIPSLQKYEL